MELGWRGEQISSRMDAVEIQREIQHYFSYNEIHREKSYISEIKTCRHFTLYNTRHTVQLETSRHLRQNGAMTTKYFIL